MGTFIIQIALVGVADGAVDFAGVLADRIFIMADIDVAFDAGDLLFSVDGAGQFIPVDVQASLGAVRHNLLQIRIAVALHAVTIVHAVLIENTPGLMRSMALNASRHLMGLFLPELATDDFHVRLLDIGMTAHAGLHYIEPADR